jgi:hypothetical protein
MYTLVLGSVSVNDLVTQIGHAQSATRPPVAPGAFALGICVLAIAAIIRTALVIPLATFRSVIPLLRTIILVVLTLVLLAAVVSLATVSGGRPALTGTAKHPTPSELSAR